MLSPPIIFSLSLPLPPSACNTILPSFLYNSMHTNVHKCNPIQLIMSLTHPLTAKVSYY